MAEGERRYSFPPLERRGVLLGLQTGQLASLLGGVAGALLISQAVPAPAGTGLAAVTMITAGVAALWPRAGQPLVVWVPIAAGWIRRRRSGAVLVPHPLAGRSPVARIADQGSAGTRAVRDTAPAGISLLEVDGGPGRDPLGLVRDRRFGTWAAVVPVQGRSFVLLDPDQQVGQLEAWRAVLGALARPGTPLRRIQWLHVSAPEGAGGRAQRYAISDPTHGEVVGLLGAPEPGGPALARQSYQELVADAGLATQGHRAWMVLAVGGAQRPGSPARRGLDDLRREVRLLDGQLRNADLRAGPPLRLADLRGLLADSRGHERLEDPGRCRSSPWPMASDEAWAALRSDGAWHATFWIAEWPRVDVTPDFLTPLLLDDGRRAVSVIMAPVPPERAAREVRAARAADVADDELRSRAGFLPSARRRREAEGVIRRESELADGHADYRFSGYVTVTAADRESLAAACLETEQAAERAHLELRRLYGRQSEAFTWTLPLARGLA